MPILHSPGVMTPGQLGPIRRDLEPEQRALDLDHVEHGNAFGDADDQRDFRVDRFQDRVGGKGRRHIDHAGGAARRGLGLAHRVEHGQAQMRGAAFAGRGAAHHLGAVGDRLLGMERALIAGEALADDARVLVDEDGHQWGPYFGVGTASHEASVKFPINKNNCHPRPSAQSARGMGAPGRSAARATSGGSPRVFNLSIPLAFCHLGPLPLALLRSARPGMTGKEKLAAIKPVSDRASCRRRSGPSRTRRTCSSAPLFFRGQLQLDDALHALRRRSPPARRHRDP